MSGIATLAANMRAAFIERKGATIGGGKFTPEELREGAVALKQYSVLIALCDAQQALIEALYCNGTNHQQTHTAEDKLRSITPSVINTLGKYNENLLR